MEIKICIKDINPSISELRAAKLSMINLSIAPDSPTLNFNLEKIIKNKEKIQFILFEKSLKFTLINNKKILGVCDYTPCTEENWLIFLPNKSNLNNTIANVKYKSSNNNHTPNSMLNRSITNSNIFDQFDYIKLLIKCEVSGKLNINSSSSSNKSNTTVKSKNPLKSTEASNKTKKLINCSKKTSTKNSSLNSASKKNNNYNDYYTNLPSSSNNLYQNLTTKQTSKIVSFFDKSNRKQEPTQTAKKKGNNKSMVTLPYLENKDKHNNKKLSCKDIKKNNNQLNEMLHNNSMEEVNLQSHDLRKLYLTDIGNCLNNSQLIDRKMIKDTMNKFSMDKHNITLNNKNKHNRNKDDNFESKYMKKVLITNATTNKKVTCYDRNKKHDLAKSSNTKLPEHNIRNNNLTQISKTSTKKQINFDNHQHNNNKNSLSPNLDIINNNLSPSNHFNNNRLNQENTIRNKNINFKVKDFENFIIDKNYETEIGKDENIVSMRQYINKNNYLFKENLNINDTNILNDKKTDNSLNNISIEISNIENNFLDKNDKFSLLFSDSTSELQICSYESLKNDYEIFYTDDYIQNIKDDLIKLELQLLIEKIYEMQQNYHKTYNYLFYHYKVYKHYFNKFSNKYLLLKRNVNDFREIVEREEIANIKNECFLTKNNNVKNTKNYFAHLNKELKLYKEINNNYKILGNNQNQEQIKKNNKANLDKIFYMILFNKDASSLSNAQKKFCELYFRKNYMNFITTKFNNSCVLNNNNNNDDYNNSIFELTSSKSFINNTYCDNLNANNINTNSNNNNNKNLIKYIQKDKIKRSKKNYK